MLTPLGSPQQVGIGVGRQLLPLHVLQTGNYGRHSVVYSDGTELLLSTGATSITHLDIGILSLPGSLSVSYPSFLVSPPK